jgi:hypothetical protein
MPKMTEKREENIIMKRENKYSKYQVIDVFKKSKNVSLFF